MAHYGMTVQLQYEVLLCTFLALFRRTIHNSMCAYQSMICLHISSCTYGHHPRFLSVGYCTYILWPTGKSTTREHSK